MLFKNIFSYFPFYKKFRSRLFHFLFLLSRPMTLGVRAFVYNSQDNSILLVYHTYIDGWHLPGGGVDTGETMEQAVTRELLEETCVEVLSPPILKSIHYNRKSSKRDHIALYLITNYRQNTKKHPDSEIKEAAFFPVTDLPKGVTDATLKRIQEILETQAPCPYW